MHTMCLPQHYHASILLLYAPEMPRSTPSSPEKKRTVTKGGLVREVAYLYVDEAEALAQRAHDERCSKSEVMRRALRAYLEEP